MPSQRILIVRTSAIGDVVFASPFAAALKRHHPQAHVAWLVEPGIHELLASDPHVDELILWPKGEWKRLWKQRRWLELFKHIREFSRLLKSKRFDTAIDLQGLLKSGWLTWLTGAPQRIGLGSREGSQWLMTKVVPKGGDIRRISSEYLHLAQHLRLDIGDFLPRLYVSDETAHTTHNLLTAHGLAPQRYAVFAPFTTRPQKHWFEDAWQTLAPLVRDELGLTPVILGGPADQDSAQRMVGSQTGVVSLAGITRLPEAAALVQNAALVIGVDTGLTHMGTAFARPTVALFGSTRPYLDTGRLTSRVIWLGLECSPCRRRPTCGGAFTCLRNITPTQVMSEARQAMANKAQP